MAAARLRHVRGQADAWRVVRWASRAACVGAIVGPWLLCVRGARQSMGMVVQAVPVRGVMLVHVRVQGVG